MDRFRGLSVRDRRLGGTAVVAAAVVVIAAGVLLTSLQPAGPGVAAASALPSPSSGLASGSTIPPGSGASPGSGPVVEGVWTPFTEPPFQPPATLTADSQDAAGVAPTTTFSLHAKAPLAAASLARSLQVSPAAPFDVVPGPDATMATLRPVGPLTGGVTYRFALTDGSGAAVGSWAFGVKQPLHVATTLPGDQSTDVPLDSGIEITFDQDGASDVAAHVTIDPPVRSHPETHGRTFVLVPDRLTPRTLYTVTVHAGIAVAGSDQTLRHDLRFSFETGIPDSAIPPVTIGAERVVLETAPRSRPTVVVTVDVPDGAKPVTSLPVRVYRLGSQAAALAALRQLVDAPGWALYSQQGKVDTSGLPRTASFTAQLGDFGDETASHWFRFPMSLPTGWYVVDIVRPERDLQLFLQVTNLATYAALTSTRTVVWVNDTSTHAPSGGASVKFAGGARLGRTDARGVLVAGTPKAILDPLTGSAQGTGAPILVVRARNGRTAFVPVGSVDSIQTHYASDLNGGGTSSDAPWFHLLYTDRTLYRQTDQVNVWGLIRARDRAVLPGKVELRLMGSGSDDGTPPIATVPVTLGPTGSFKASLPLGNVPIGSYVVELWSGAVDLAQAGFAVDIIRKPAYLIAASTDRHAVVAGTAVAVKSHLTFYDGTAVPATAVRAGGFDNGNGTRSSTGTTDGAGVAVVTLPALINPDMEGYAPVGLTVNPVGPEEGSISGTSTVLVFPSTLWLDGKVALKGGRLLLTGSVHDVDLAGLERHAREIAAGDYGPLTLDPRGRARVGLVVDAAIVELIPVKTFAGRTYDFITKEAVDTYTYTTSERSLGTTHLRSGAGGRIHLDEAVDDPSHAFRVTLTVRDPKGRVTRLTLDAEVPPPAMGPDLRPHLTDATPQCSIFPTSSSTFAVGDTIRTTMVDGHGPLPSGGSNAYLFLTAQRGLRSVTVQGSPRFRAAFTRADIPSLTVLGVQFNGDSYAPAGEPYAAGFDTRARALSIHLATDAPAYRPGGLVTLAVETRDATGRPVAATVIVRAVDQKLFTIGGADVIDPLADLYVGVPDGILRTHASRSDLYPVSNGGCGAAGGGGRDDFRDSILFRTVSTDATGRATVTFNVADDLTSWHLSASAVTASLQAGSSDILIPVRLSFFAEAGLAPEYLMTDRPFVRVRAFGASLRSGDSVTFTVSSTTLPMAATTARGTAFQPIDIPLPTLPLGDQTLTIVATTGSGSHARSDTLIRHFTVVSSRLMTIRTGYAAVTAGLAPAHGDGQTTYVLSDAGRGRFLAFLDTAAASDGARLDQALARAVARDLIARYFGSTESGAGAGSPDDPAPFDPNRYTNDQGLALLPYGGPELELSAEAALVAPERLNAIALRDYFQGVLDDQQSTRERRVLALAGRAGLGDPVLPAVRTAVAAGDLTPVEQLYLGLAAAALGDGATALRMETALLRSYGQRQGPWVRLAVGKTLDEGIHATSLLAMLAAEVGDPVADAADAHVSTHPTRESVTTLLQVGYVQAAIAHAPAAPARFAYTVDGVRREKDLAPGQAFRLVLAAGQAASLRLDPLSGSTGVASSWEAPAGLAATPVDPAVTITRTRSPSGDVPAARVVTVRLTLDFRGTLAQNECYEVTDLAPSGLVPVSRLEGWPQTDEAGNPATSDVLDPYAIEGQRVRFCAQPVVAGSHLVMLRYYARVVTVGTYVWEPAVAGSSLAPAGVARTMATTIVIR